jgi:hypothetical protein
MYRRIAALLPFASCTIRTAFFRSVAFSIGKRADPLEPPAAGGKALPAFNARLRFAAFGVCVDGDGGAAKSNT